MREPSSGGTGSRLNTASVMFTFTMVDSTRNTNSQNALAGAR